MGDDAIPVLAGVTLRKGEPRSPKHRYMLEMSGRIVPAWLLKSIDSNHTARRNTLVITEPNQVLAYLTAETQRNWNRFRERICQLQRQWRFHNTPALKRVVRLNRAHTLFQEFDLATVVHHHGAVPVLLVGRVDGYQVGLYPGASGQHISTFESRDEEVRELLQSMSEFLPLMLHAYFEQIAFYLEAIFYSAPDEKVMGLCQRIRAIAKGSIVQKLDLLDNIPVRLRRSRSLASELSNRFEDQIREARAVDAFSHLLVNYIYRFFCITDRVAEYAARLQAIPSRRTLFDLDAIAFMQECARNIETLDDSFLAKLESGRTSREEWLQTMGEASAFVAEIVKSTNEAPIERPKVFVTHHYKVQDSEKFVDLLKAIVHRENINVEIVHGRKLSRDIRWSILARIWMCDHHVLFLPASWMRIDGVEKSLKRERNWVVLELFYGSLLERGLTLIVAEPYNERIIEDFRRQLTEYTTAREIPQAPEEGWRKIVEETKKDLAQFLHTQRRIGCKLDSEDMGEFCERFVNEILKPTRQRLLEVLFGAWRTFFDLEAWSVVQALVEMLPPGEGKSCTIKDIAQFLREGAAKNSNFRWVRRYQAQRELETAIRDKHLGRPDRFGTLRQFSFTIGGERVAPVVAEYISGRLMVSLRIDETYRQFCTLLQISENVKDLQTITSRLLAFNWRSADRFHRLAARTTGDRG